MIVRSASADCDELALLQPFFGDEKRETSKPIFTYEVDSAITRKVLPALRTKIAPKGINILAHRWQSSLLLFQWTELAISNAKRYFCFQFNLDVIKHLNTSYTTSETTTSEIDEV